MAALYTTIWLSLLLFCAGEAGRWTGGERGRTPAKWAWWAYAAGAALCVVHIVVAMAVAHGWSHASAVEATARQTAAVYGLDWGGGVFVNYLFVAVWLLEAWRWRSRGPGRRVDAITWAARILFLIVIVNGAVVFASSARRIAGAAIVAVLLWIYFRRGRGKVSVMVRAVLIVTLVAAGLAAAPPQPAGQAAVRALTGVRIVPLGVSPGIENATIIIRDGRIVALGAAGKFPVPAGAEITKLDGKFVVPGLISAHAHVSDVDGLKPRAYTMANTLRQLGVFARYGITTVWSLGGEQAPAFEARDTQSVATLNRARIYLAGEVVTGATPEAARAAVARVAAMKADVIKIRVDDNLGSTTKMAPDVYRAVIDEAHTHKLRVAAHIFYLDDAKDLLRAGVDAIVHSVRDRDVDEEFLSLMKSAQVPYVPTLTREISTFVYESTPEFFGDPFFLKEADAAVVAQLKEPARQSAMRDSRNAQRYKAGLEIAKRNLKRIADAGILIAMGTDAGPSPERFVGYFEHLEMQMMVDAGMTPAQVLRAATVDAARAMRVDGIGSLVPGAWADLVVLDQDPLRDIRNTRRIAGVWIAGNPVTR